MSEEGATKTAETPKRGKRARIIAGVVAVALVALVAYVGHGIWVGDIAPSDAAAKYDGFTYLPESEVSDYIAVYREQMGLGDSSDEDWATFLAAYNLTPQRLRYSTIQQLVTDALVQKKADNLGLSASEEEIDATVDTLRNTLGLGDDEILQQTLEAHGQTEEGLREVYRQAIVKRLVLSAEVETPTPTEDQVKDYLKTILPTLAANTVRHTYCFRLNGVAESGERDKMDQVQDLQKQFIAGAKTQEAFAAMVQMYGNDDGLAETGGANGWDIDTSSYSNTYIGVMEDMVEGDVSGVFRDGESLCFIWVDEEYTLPSSTLAVDDLDVADVPASLWSYLSDAAAYQLWEAAGQEYLDALVEDAQVVYYPMPSDVPYNVDMSLADVQLEELEGGEGESGQEVAEQEAAGQDGAGQ